MDTLVTDTIGMIGTFSVLLAYYLLQLEKIPATGMGRARHHLEEAGVAHATVQEASAEELPFSDGSFDLVTSNGAINLMPDKLAVFVEIHRVLRPAGRLQFADVVRTGEPSKEQGDPDAWSR